MDAIVAVYSDWGIGSGGTQPVVLKADRSHFVELTRGRTVIVGRRTLADFPGGRPLKYRRNIVITRQNIEIEGAEIAHGADEAISLCRGDAMVLGGASVFKEFFRFLDRVFVTKIDCCPESDCFFPNLDDDPDWVLAESGETLHEGDIAYRFLRYERK